MSLLHLLLSYYILATLILLHLYYYTHFTSLLPFRKDAIGEYHQKVQSITSSSDLTHGIVDIIDTR